MVRAVSGQTRLRKCFITGSLNEDADLISQLLIERGVEVIRADRLVLPGTALREEILRHLATVDFVVAILPSQASPFTFYELGVAKGLRKPVLAFVRNLEMPMDVRGLYIVRLDSPTNAPIAAGEIDRFLRHAKAPPPLKVEKQRDTKPVDLRWAREWLAQLKSRGSATREENLEQLVGEVFKRTGAEVTRAAEAQDRGVDFVVWANDVAYELGTPILVECKAFGGGSGSVIRNLEHVVRHLDELVSRSEARLAILVYDHELRAEPPSLYHTARVVLFSAESLIGAIERGSLAQEILSKRGRAATVGSLAVGD
jgi:hypothetical protein